MIGMLKCDVARVSCADQEEWAKALPGTDYGNWSRTLVDGVSPFEPFNALELKLPRGKARPRHIAKSLND